MNRTWGVVLGTVAGVALVCALYLILRHGERSVSGELPPDVAAKLDVAEREIISTQVPALFPLHFPRGVDRLRLESREPLDDSIVERGEFSLPDPGGEFPDRLIAPDGSAYLELSGDGEAEPDSVLWLVSLVAQERRRLLFYGPEITLDDARWIGNDVIAVVGVDNGADGESASEEAILWLIRLRERVVSIYGTSDSER
ncbi:MAG: hypothetical protein M0042_02955 [Nitrospiraceae bacterium]|nr:hypothetical protein [Nitrospiraceae bacterium]